MTITRVKTTIRELDSGDGANIEQVKAELTQAQIEEYEELKRFGEIYEYENRVKITRER